MFGIGKKKAEKKCEKKTEKKRESRKDHHKKEGYFCGINELLTGDRDE